MDFARAEGGERAAAEGVGAQAAVVFGDAAVGVASAIMTLLVLVCSEIIPKTLGANYWRQLTGVVCQTLLWLIPLLKPFVWLSELLTKIFSSNKNDSGFIRSEIAAMAELGKEEGELAEDESQIIGNLLRFRHVRATDIMTPRSVLFRVTKTPRLPIFWSSTGSNPFSRILVTDKDDDDITGYALKSDIMLAFHRLGGRLPHRQAQQTAVHRARNHCPARPVPRFH